jgi:hypothetical protein
VVEAGHAISRDIPPSVITWSRWKLFPKRYGLYQAIRFVLYWGILFKQEKYLRMRNVVTNEHIEEVPLRIAYSDPRSVGR